MDARQINELSDPDDSIRGLVDRLTRIETNQKRIEEEHKKIVSAKPELPMYQPHKTEIGYFASECPRYEIELSRHPKDDDFCIML